MRLVTEDQAARMVDLYKQGHTSREVAKLTGRTQATVLVHLGRAGVTRPTGVGRNQTPRGGHGSSQRDRERARHRDKLRRCYDPADQGWPNYGGRGIHVHPDWRLDLQECPGAAEKRYQAYVGTLDKPEGWDESWEIDRIDNDGHYWPGNLRWLSQEDNRRNKGHKIKGMVPLPADYSAAIAHALARRAAVQLSKTLAA